MKYPAHPFRGFTSDNAAGIHPKLLKSISDSNCNHVYTYGHDPYTDQAIVAFKRQFGIEANLVFAHLPAAAIEPLQALYPFHISHPERQEVRFVCSFDTTPADIGGLAMKLHALCR